MKNLPKPHSTLSPHYLDIFSDSERTLEEDIDLYEAIHENRALWHNIQPTLKQIHEQPAQLTFQTTDEIRQQAEFDLTLEDVLDVQNGKMESAYRTRVPEQAAPTYAPLPLPKPALLETVKPTPLQLAPPLLTSAKPTSRSTFRRIRRVVMAAAVAGIVITTGAEIYSALTSRAEAYASFPSQTKPAVAHSKPFLPYSSPAPSPPLTSLTSFSTHSPAAKKPKTPSPLPFYFTKDGEETKPIQTSGYGPRLNPKTQKTEFHRARDYSGPRGSLISWEQPPQTLPFTVDYVGEDAYNGKHVRARNGSLTIDFCHLEKILAHEGKILNPDEPVGTLGGTGRVRFHSSRSRAENGTLHLQYGVNGQAVTENTFRKRLEREERLAQNKSDTPTLVSMFSPNGKNYLPKTR